MSTKIVEYHVRDSKGAVVRYGTCSEDTFNKQTNPGETVHAGLPSRIPETPPMFGDNYIANRYLAYPPIADQLDILYHKGFEAWKQVITEVKQQYPKP